MKKHILFVDDEPRILDGLRRMLRGMRDTWDMHFVESGEAAIDRLRMHPFDVVVSDMRMPGMDGALLLNEVRETYPHIVRIILSGHSDNEMILRSVGPAHQYLAKPCDPDRLRQCVERAIALRAVVHNDKLERTIGGIESLPSLPTQYVQVQEELSSPEPSICRLGKIIEQDVGMTSKVLQLVNSAFFGLRHEVSSAAEAVKLLGLDIVGSLILTMHVFRQFDGARSAGIAIERVTAHSLGVATFARAICRSEEAEKTLMSHAFLGGLLHDAGKLILANCHPGEYELVLQRHGEKPDIELERTIFGVTHAEAGAYLLGLWGLPDALVEAVAFHHTPSSTPLSDFAPLTAVHVANALEHRGEDDDELEEVVDIEHLVRLNLNHRLPDWEQACQSNVRSGTAI
ncbi:MAG: HDOD domain-containing protein [Phycisphaerae bacterium]|nr:HDOD domain-containing protein [Phycisphaerae bacterium]